MRPPTLPLALLSLALAAAAAGAATEAVPDVPVVRELRPGVWLHTSHHTYPGGTRFPSNGLAVADGDGLLLVDTAWGEVATIALLDRLEAATGRRVRRAIVTHHHYDRVAGADVLAARGVEVLAQPATPRLASALGIPAPRTSVAALTEVGGAFRVGPAELFYPGPGHAADNLVVWLPEQKVLFGGCAVRAAATGSLGNTDDADLAGWAEAIRRLRARYPQAEVVVPGHGEPGGATLLEHTLALLEPEPPAAAPAAAAGRPVVTHAAGVAAHAGLDAVYERFAAGYDALDPAAVAALYTVDALYLPAGEPTRRGRDEIAAGFRGFFDAVRSNGERLAIEFEILDRKVDEELATDVGIYTLSRLAEDGEIAGVGRGRFTVVAVRGDDGDWRFHVDAYSALDGP